MTDGPPQGPAAGLPVYRSAGYCTGTPPAGYFTGRWYATR